MDRDLQLLADMVEAYIVREEANGGASSVDWAVRSILGAMYETAPGGDDSLWSRVYRIIRDAFTTETREWEED